MRLPTRCRRHTETAVLLHSKEKRVRVRARARVIVAAAAAAAVTVATVNLRMEPNKILNRYTHACIYIYLLLSITIE